MMNKILIGLIFLVACQGKQSDKPMAPNGAKQADRAAQQRRQDSLAIQEEAAVQQGKYKTYWGYRFHIEGDFNGDGKKETLREQLISARTGKEIGKFCGFEEDTTPECYWTERVNRFRQPKCHLTCSNPAVGDFQITTAADSTGTIGLIFLQNVGDLNGDKTDEIALIEDGGGCNSGIRTIWLATFKKGKWNTLIEAETREYDFPTLDQEAIISPEDLKKILVTDFEKKLAATPPYFKKQNDKLVYQDYETATLVTKHLKINW